MTLQAPYLGRGAEEVSAARQSAPKNYTGHKLKASMDMYCWETAAAPSSLLGCRASLCCWGRKATVFTFLWVTCWGKSQGNPHLWRGRCAPAASASMGTSLAFYPLPWEQVFAHIPAWGASKWGPVYAEFAEMNKFSFFRPSCNS